MKKFERKHLSQMVFVPTLWVEGTPEDCKPIVDCYAHINQAIRMAASAAELGFGFRLDFYRAPVDDLTSQDEAHIVIWKEIKSDALMGVRQ